MAFSYPSDWSVEVEEIQPFVRYTVTTSGSTRLWFDVYDFAEISGPEGLAEVVIFQTDQAFYGLAAFRTAGHPRPHWREILGASRRGVDIVCELVVVGEGALWDVHTWSAVEGERRSANVFLVGPRDEEQVLGQGVDLVLGSLEWATP